MLRSAENSRGTGPRATGTGHLLDRTAPFEDAPNNETETRLDTYYITRYHIFAKAGSLFSAEPNMPLDNVHFTTEERGK